MAAAVAGNLALQPGDDAPGDDAASLLKAADSNLDAGKRKEALQAGLLSLVSARQAGDKAAEAAALCGLAKANVRSKKPQEAVKKYEQACAIYRQVGDLLSQAAALLGVAEIHLADAAFGEALEAAGDARKLCQRAGVSDSEAWGLCVRAYAGLGRPQDAVKIAKDELVAARRRPGAAVMAASEQRLIETSLRTGDVDGALHAAKKACVRRYEAGDWKGQASMLHVASGLHLKADRAELALRAAQEALAILKDGRGQAAATREEAELSAKLRSLIAEAHVARGEEPPLTESRAAALCALEELGKALEAREAAAFREALEKAERIGGVSLQDQANVIVPIVEKDSKASLGLVGRSSAAAFVRAHMPSSELLVDPDSRMQVVCLRRFPAEPPEGEAGGVKWVQTMGKITLSYPLEGPTAGDKVTVEVSSYMLQVKLDGKKLPILTGELSGPVLPARCWWNVHREEVKRRTRGVDTVAVKCTLVIQLSKQEQWAWSDVWYGAKGGLQHPSGRGRYAWTAEMHEEAQEEKAELTTLVSLPFGAPTPSGPVVAYGTPLADQAVGAGDPFTFAPDDMVVGLDVQQTDRELIVCVHFDGEALTVVNRHVVLEDLLAADVFEDHLAVFLRGDEQNPIMLANLAGRCRPELTTWSVVESDLFRNRQVNPSAPAKALKVTIVKSDDARGRWGRPFASCYQHRLMLKNSEELRQLLGSLQADAEARANLVQGSGDQAQEWQSMLLPEQLRDDIRRRVAEWKEERFEPLAGAEVLPRRASDIQEPDFGASVAKAVDQITKRTGHEGGARWNSQLGRYSYIY